MKATRIVSLSILTAALTLSGLAQAESTLTRAEVKAEAAEAIRTGNIVDAETGMKLNELFPGAYPKQVKVKSVPARQTQASTTVVSTGDIEMDQIVQRNSEVMARRQGADNQVAGRR
ncbi:MAG TPA: DUF4148 domain-containing protein [Aquabacterium sp.]|nr:DUF4148 domain-containing protein [Aquabacterium sp.]HRH27769.1 DUF4148 domain-containing protein [Aquabacterium sp.]